MWLSEAVKAPPCCGWIEQAVSWAIGLSPPQPWTGWRGAVGSPQGSLGWPWQAAALLSEGLGLPARELPGGQGLLHSQQMRWEAAVTPAKSNSMGLI